MSSDAPSGPEPGRTNGTAGPVAGHSQEQPPSVTQTDNRQPLGFATTSALGFPRSSRRAKKRHPPGGDAAAACRAELTMRAAEVAALEREIVRRERRHEEVVKRYENLLDQRRHPDSVAVFGESDHGLLATVRRCLPL